MRFARRFLGADMHTIVLAIGFIGGVLYIASHYAKPWCRCASAKSSATRCSSLRLSLSVYPTLFLYGILIPLNAYRLYEMIELIHKVRHAAQGDLSMNWLKPYMSKRHYKSDLLFSKGDHASEDVLHRVHGKCRVAEINVDLPEGRLVGELGFLTPSTARTQSVECVEDTEMMVITYDKLSEPTSASTAHLRLTGERLLQNMKRLEQGWRRAPKPRLPNAHRWPHQYVSLRSFNDESSG